MNTKRLITFVFLVFFVFASVPNFVLAFRQQGNPALQEFLNWRNKEEIGRWAVDFVEILHRLDKKAYSSIKPENKKKMIDQMEFFLGLLINTSGHKWGGYIPKKHKEQEEKNQNFSGVGMGVSSADEGYLESFEKEREKLFNSFPFSETEFEDVEITALVFRLMLKKPEFKKLYENFKNPVLGDKGLLIDKIMPGQGAHKAGVEEGWFAVGVKSKEEESLFKGLRLKDAVDLIRGPEGTKVLLKLLSPDGKTKKEIEVMRGLITKVELKAKMLSDDVGYLSLDTFIWPTEGADFQTKKGREKFVKPFVDKVNELKKKGMKKGLVLDLRDNTGGLFVLTDMILERLISPGEITVYYNYPHIPKKEDVFYSGYFISPPESEVPKILSKKTKIIVLVNRNSASGSEVMSVALRDRGAIVVGENTTGKGTILSEFHLKTGGTFMLPTGRYFSPVKEEDIEGVGVTPDVYVVDDPKTENDEAIDVALKVLQSTSPSVGDGYPARMINKDPKHRVEVRIFEPSNKLVPKYVFGLMPDTEENKKTSVKNFQMEPGVYKIVERYFDGDRLVETKQSIFELSKEFAKKNITGNKVYKMMVNSFLEITTPY